ncbi:MAG: hypothetical protein PHH54_03395 [Candidatus Nanoarchaeia archaeon]|nr:hypothetical protein [Candidatus Nanoarchaeia archaeon]MDD5741002.1 hypothetical protein [Candidatus Nanoarchaeia archaeon]
MEEIERIFNVGVCASVRSRPYYNTLIKRIEREKGIKINPCWCSNPNDLYLLLNEETNLAGKKDKIEVSYLVTELLFNMTSKEGLHMLKPLKNEFPGLPVIVCEMYGKEYFPKIRDEYGYECIEKHLEDDKLIEAVSRYLK